MATLSEKEWAKRVLQHEDYMPWGNVKRAKEILGLPRDGLTPEEQAQYDRVVGRQAEVEIRKHEIDAQIESAMQAKARHGYTVPAVIVKSWVNPNSPFLGFFFAHGYKVGDVGRHADKTHFQVLAVV